MRIYMYVHNNTSIKLIRQISEGAKSSQRGGQTKPSPAGVQDLLESLCRESTHLGKEKNVQHRKFSEGEASFWIKIK